MSEPQDTAASSEEPQASPEPTTDARTTDERTTDERTAANPESTPSELVIWGLLAIFIIGMTGIAVLRRMQTAPKQPLPILAQVTHFEMTNRDGRTVDLTEFAGSPWVADFIFTRCVGMCPLMSASMRRVASNAPATAGLKLVSFSVDPEHDTPEVLNAYAERFGAGPNWYFLNAGGLAEIREVARGAFLLGVEEAPEDAPDATEDIIHSNRLVLIDSASRVRGYYDGLDQVEVDRLLVDLKRLLKEGDS